jgi:hypothetical protein
MFKYQKISIKSLLYRFLQFHWIYVDSFGAGIIFFILAHPVNKIWIIQKSNMLELWNKLHFEEKKTDSIHHD